MSKEFDGFTLIETLIVLAIGAVLATAAIIIINPAEYFKEARDTRRVSDLNQIDLSLATLTAAAPRTDLGNANTVYISLPDSATDCSSYSLPALPSGWSYQCATSANFRNANGTGWIPVDFTKYPAGTLLSVLPIDPVNTDQDDQYYTYVTGGSWSLASRMESKKQLEQRARKNGEFDPERFVIGSNTTLWRNAYGIVGYWKFDEGSGTTAVDSSGKGNSGTLTNSPTWQPGTSCKLGACLDFGRTLDQYVNVPNLSSYKTSAATISVWFNPKELNNNHVYSILASLAGEGSNPDSGFHQRGEFNINTNGTISAQMGSYSGGCSANYRTVTSVQTVPVNEWSHAVVVMEFSPIFKVALYLNGVSAGVSEAVVSCGNDFSFLWIGRRKTENNMHGLIDDFRLYNRALSATEISKIYNATR